MFQKFLNEHDLSEFIFRSDIFPTIEDRAFWDAFQNEECVALAEQAMDYNWPAIKATDFMAFKANGNRMIMEDIHFDRRRHLILFALAELKENKGRFLPQIVNGLFSTCEESYWGLSAHWASKKHELGNIPRADEPYIDLFAAETAEHLAVIANLLAEPLTDFCPEILDRVENELERRIKAPYFIHRGWSWLGYKNPTNNWNPWILSNVLTVFLLTEKNRRRLLRALKKLLTEVQFYYNSVPADGGCDEGPDYWNQAGARLFEVAYQLHQATDGEIDLLGDEKLGLMAAYMKKVHLTSDLFVNVADAHMSGKAAYMVMLFGFAKETKQKDLMNFSAAVYQEKGVARTQLSHKTLTMRRLIYQSQWLREIQEYPVSKPLHGTLECLPDMQLAVLRKGEMILSAKGGFNQEHHNHNDVGSFALNDGFTPLLVDTGICTYTRFVFQGSTRYTMIPWTQSSYHNLPMVNGAAQLYGKQFRADDFFADEEKIAISYASAYPEEAGIAKLDRSLHLTDTGLACTDRFVWKDANAATVTEVLMSVLPVRIEKNEAILGEKYRLQASCGEIAAEYVPFNDAQLEAAWGCEGVNRITITAEKTTEINLKVEKV